MNKPNKTELEYFIRWSTDSDKYKRYMELYEEIERLNEIIKCKEDRCNWYQELLTEQSNYIKKLESKLKGVDKE